MQPDDNGDLQAEIMTGSDTVAFTNKYEDTTNLTLTGTKTLTGRNMAADEFSFTVKEGTKTITTGTNAAADKGTAGAIVFETINYDQNDIGEHTYTITEAQSE